MDILAVREPKTTRDKLLTLGAFVVTMAAVQLIGSVSTNTTFGWHGFLYGQLLCQLWELRRSGYFKR